MNSQYQTHEQSFAIVFQKITALTSKLAESSDQAWWQR